MPPSGGIGTVRVAVRNGVRPVAKSPAPVPVPPPMIDHLALSYRLAQPHLEMTAWSCAVSCARHHARQLLWDLGLKELIEPVELVVSEIVTNAVRASGGLDEPPKVAGTCASVVRLWLSAEPDAVLVLVWDRSPLKPVRQDLAPDAESGRGLLLVEMFSAAWGSFELEGEPGKVVWALCQS
jgi:anti-sigma regulatory factor (Ser/Thr protein kinase)